MKVAHLIPYLGRAQGGPVFGLAGYAAALTKAGCHVEVFSVATDADGEPMELAPDIRVNLCREPRWGAFRRCPELWQALAQSDFQIVHSHSLWTDVNRLAAATARRRRIPHLLAPCGTLALKALRHRWWKKLPVRVWFQMRALRDASCLHAKSPAELADIRRIGFRNPVAVIANPVLLPATRDACAAERFRQSFRVPGDRRVLLYLGRLHPVKGVPRLIEAWASLREEHARWHLVLAGPDERGYRREFASLAAKLDCNQSVTFTGELSDCQKWAAYAAAELFVMPSDFENFGIAIVEAMMAQLPVITTTGTPWREVATTGAGWWIEPQVAALAEALREAIALPQERRREMGRQAASLAARFRPEQAGADLIQVYQWLLAAGPRPECVRVD